VAAEILKLYKPYRDDPTLTAYLNHICQALAINSSMPTLFAGYNVEILDTGEICAYATTGGHIFISRGLIACAPSEDGLAAVLAHEIAHIQLRHAAAILQNERLIQDLSAAADRAAFIAARDLTPQERSVLFRETVSSAINILFRDGYSRNQEFEADRLARLLLIAAGYDPAALGELLGILETRLQPGNMISTHPAPAARIASLGSLPENIRGGTGQDTLPARRARFDSIVKR
jgi:predicted Zn-dependent protease